jgi:uncharacterized repeat protein (TIGR01451 family)
MNKTFFKIGLGLLALAGMAWPSRGAVTGMKTLTGHVPAVVSQLAPVGRLSATNRLHLAIGLPLRNQEALTNLLRQLYDPSSPNYQHYLTPDEFTAQFGPTPGDYQAVLDFANTNGFTVEQTHANRMLVDVAAQASDVERAFHVKMMTYHHPKEARDFYAPNAEPTVSSDLPVLAVQGVNNYALPHDYLLKRPASLARPSIGSGPQGGYMGQDFRTAYIPNSPLNGTGQTVGLLQFDGYYSSDIQTYETLAGLTNVPLNNVLLDGFNGAPGPANDEVCLDIEMAVSMAPALASVVVFEAGPVGNPDDILSAMASSNQIKQLSSSWGYATDPASEQFYLQFAVQGQTYLNASGDGDAWVGAVTYASLEDPNVTVVGGTSLTMNGTASSYASETAWNSGYTGDYGHNPDGYSGTSGGVSTDVPIPYYQVGVNMVTNQGSTTFRNLPDVALTADNIFIVSSGGAEGLVGGTSAATPLWAGFMALVNQQAVANGKPSIGFLAPAAYALAKTAIYTNCFHDTVAGSNTWDQSPTKFFAVPGYDLCTGLGTPNGTNLVNALTGTNSTTIVVTTPVIPAPKQPWGSTLSVMDGSNPNGLWFLFFQDDHALYSGTNYNGWMLNLTTANPVGFPADNQLLVNETNVAVTPGSDWVTILSVTNYGPAAATNVVVTDTLPDPSGVTLVSSSTLPASSSVTVFADTLTWTVGNLPVNAGGTLTLTFRGNVTGIYTNSAVVNATTVDPNPDDDLVGVSIIVAPTPAPVLNPRFVKSGGSSASGFQLSVTNDAGSTVIIQASTNLVTWQPIATNVSPFVFTNFDVTNFTSRFYRALIEQ